VNINQQLLGIHELLEALQPIAAKDDLLVSGLPSDLQKKIRGYQNLIGPITSSGLEHVYQVFNRLDFARYKLEYPESQAKKTGGAEKSKPAQSQNLSTNSSQSVTITRLPSEEKHTDTASPTLDFGPFDPRKG
jgi:hypothetical protein